MQFKRDCGADGTSFVLLQPQENKQKSKTHGSFTDWLHFTDQKAGNATPHLASCGTAALSFSQVMTGVGTPSTWHSKRAAPPTFTLWGDGCWWNFDRPADKESDSVLSVFQAWRCDFPMDKRNKLGRICAEGLDISTGTWGRRWRESAVNSRNSWQSKQTWWVWEHKPRMFQQVELCNFFWDSEQGKMNIVNE